MSVASLNDAISALEKRAEVLERGWMANKDVQGRRRAPELPQRVAHLSVARMDGPSIPRMAQPSVQRRCGQLAASWG